MKITTISFRELMRECHIKDPGEFNRLLRRNALPIVSPKKPIQRDVANTIAKRLLGHHIDWYKYERKLRDIDDKGPLERTANLIECEVIDNWYAKIVSGQKDISAHTNSLFGVVCSGGFLGGNENRSDFIFSLDPSINILIGDRGSGKSTALNLLGLVADSISEETDVLVTKLLNLFRRKPEIIANLSRRVRRGLRQYGIQRYASFFTQASIHYCYYVDYQEKAFDVLEKTQAGWVSAELSDEIPRPSIHLLKQGEVIRIAEEKNEFYIHNILDGLFPALYTKRNNFAEDIKQLINQFYFFEKTRLAFNANKITRFLFEREQELENLWNDLDEGGLSGKAVHTLQGYIDRFRSIDRAKLPMTIYEMLNAGEDAFYYLYLSRISKFLSETTKDLAQLRTEQLITLDSDISEEDIDPINVEELSDEIINDEKTLHEIEQNSDFEDVLLSDDEKLFLRVIEDQREIRITKQISSRAQKLFDFLQTRLRVLRSWVRIYSHGYIILDEALSSLINKYINLLQNRMELIKEQEGICQTITESVNEDKLEIRISTQGFRETMSEYEDVISRFSRVQVLFGEFLQATPKTPLNRIYDLATSYDSTVKELLSRLNAIRDSQDTYLFDPIEIGLRQGNIYRPFNHLSFGQKSGIILKIILTTTDKHVILIDQPEDHLDANSVVNMLIPTINQLGINKQVIIATHDSNLVMGLPRCHLIVLESLGENGRICFQGSPFHNRQAIAVMLDVLEGGLDSFNERMSVYENFVIQLRGLIEDMDIVKIESSFRRRTIDELRNFLQPIISDRELINYVRHELKQLDYSRIQADIINTVQSVIAAKLNPESAIPNLLEQLEKLCIRLDNHILELLEAIEEIRLMDTQSKPQSTNLYKLLDKLSQEYMSELSGRRGLRIDIDPTLDEELIKADPDHLKLIFRNLINNSLRATERKAILAFQSGQDNELAEIIKIECLRRTQNAISILFKDNGCGIQPEILNKLYVERCSDQKGRDHGLGGILIRKLLDLNGGNIRIVGSSISGDSTGTEQEINLPVST